MPFSIFTMNNFSFFTAYLVFIAKATSDDIAPDKMVLIWPSCNVAYIVQARTVRAVPA